MAKYAVIIPAAGKGERFGKSEKKTFAKLDGRPVFLRTVEHFINREDVCQTILAVAPEDMEEMKSRYGANLGFMGVTLVEGGARRVDTVAAALKQVSEDAEYIAVHDAARPCVLAGMIDAVFAEAIKTGAAILADPITGTVKRVGESKIIEETVSRMSLYQAQTPQVFRRQWLLDAYAKREGFQATDEAQLVERLGHKVAVVPGSPMNLKIATKEDLRLAERVMKALPKPKLQGPAHPFGDDDMWR